MVDPNVLKEVRNSLHNETLLYVEDNVSLNTRGSALFQKIFDTVVSASDGKEGLELYAQHRPRIVITDIKMPKMDGMTMAKEILKIAPETKIIFTTAYNENELLHEALKLGAMDYLVKPITIHNVLDVLIRCAEEFRSRMHENLFNMYLQNIFNYQQNLVMLLRQQSVVMVNQPCLDFFGAANIEIFKKQFTNFGELLLEHNTFLYNHDGIDWFDEIKQNPTKLFNVKIADTNGNSHHFVLSIQKIPDKEEYYVLSLNDVTELNLLKLFDAGAMEREAIQKDKKSLYGLLEMAKRNNVKIKLHNLYKGLSITNDGIVLEVDEKQISVSTTFMQLKAIQFEKRIILVSDIFPMFIESIDIKQINFDQQRVNLGECRIAMTSPTRRQYIRVLPDENARATLLYQGHKFETDIAMLDISIVATRLKLASLPSGMRVSTEVIIDLVLMTSHRPLIINTKATVFRISEQSTYYEVVFMYELHDQKNKNLVEYIAARQLDLIREFKGLQYGE